MDIRVPPMNVKLMKIRWMSLQSIEEYNIWIQDMIRICTENDMNLKDAIDFVTGEKCHD